MDFGSGIYIHFPYCARKCPYCDFNSRATVPAPAGYAGAVAREIVSRAGAFAGLTFTSIYFGGGTPSLWEPRCVGAVIEEARGALRFDGAPETTIEVNPGTVSADGLAGFRAAGVDRVSIGVQSFDPVVLGRLGRLHGPDEGLAAVEMARGAGFRRVGVDLMYGAPAQSVESFTRSMALAVASGVDHVSLYALTVHEDTPFGRTGEAALGLPPEEQVVVMYGEARAFLAAAGFIHYEIANWARPGSECVHNLNCWAGGYYLGAGAGAHGHQPQSGIRDSGSGTRSTKSENQDAVFRVRYANVPDPEAYIAAIGGGELPVAFTERVDASARARELIYTGLRMMRGIDLDWLSGEVPPEDLDRICAAAPRLAGEGLVSFDGRTVKLSARGELFADRIALSLI